MERFLHPLPRIQFRVGLFVLLIIPPLVTSGPWTGKISAVVMVSFLVGTYRRSVISGGTFQTNMTWMFIPFSPRRCKLKYVATIETGLEPRAGWWTFFLFGPSFWVFSRICDFLMPWIGGEMKLWLRSAKGKRLLAWQGNSNDHFQANLAMLKNATGAEVVRT